MRNTQSKITVVEKIIIFSGILTLAGIGVLGYVLWHFISKVW